MKAGEEKFIDLLKKEVQFKVPIYQRLYDWRAEHCQTLLNDIEKLLSNPKIPIHFMGSIVYIDEKGQSRIGSTQEVLVIDGQQRITTFTLLFIILEKLAKDKESDNALARKIRNNCLVNEYSKLQNKNKLILTKKDNIELEEFLRGENLDIDDYSKVNSNLKHNYILLKRRIEELLKKHTVDQIYDIVNKIMVVDVCLFHDIDNPQQIFESLNATGKSLTDGDLIRNYIMMNMTNDDQIKIYNSCWNPMEIILGDSLTYFITNYIYMKKGISTNIRDLYKEFKDYSFSKYYQRNNELASDMLVYSKYFNSIRNNKSDDPEIKEALMNLNQLGISSHIPLMLKVFNEYEKERLDAEDFKDIVKVIESFLFRRGICSVPTNSLNPIFRTTWSKLIKNNLKQSLIQTLKSGEGNKRWPNNDELKNVLASNSIYGVRFTRFLLIELEKYENKEANKDFSTLTVEHVLPQTNGDAEKLSIEWKNMLGTDYRQIRDRWIHTLGNLTLTGYNSEYSAKSFNVKKKMKNGYIDSGLRLNKQISEYKIWNEKSILDRAEKLTDIAIDRWSLFS